MRRIGKLILFVFAVGILAVTYWLTPRLLHSPSQLVNFAQLIGVSCVAGLALMIIGGLLFVGNRLMAPPPAGAGSLRGLDPSRYPKGVNNVGAKAPATGNTPISPEWRAEQFKQLRGILRLSLSLAPANDSDDPYHQRITHVTNAVTLLASIAESNCKQ